MSLRLTACLALCAAAPATAQHAHHDHAPAPKAAAAPAVPVAARTQLDQLRRAVARYADIDVARREGWKRFGGDEPLMGEHWTPPDGRDYQGADVQLDFTRPNNLMYTRIDGKPVLTGVAYVVRLREGEALPQGFAGDADRWHVHDALHAIQAMTEERPLLRWLANSWIHSQYLAKGDDRGRLAMVHAWVTLPNPDGVFADHNRLLAYRKLGLPDAHADGASLDAARGLSLAAEHGCRDAVDAKLWIADAPRAAGRRIRAACNAQAATVARAVAEHRAHPPMVNAAAEAAWRAFDAVWARELTGAQRARVAALTEHGAHDGH